MTRVKRGEKVRDRCGRTHEARGQIGNTVYLVDGTWIHRSNCWRLDARGRVIQNEEATA